MLAPILLLLILQTAPDRDKICADAVEKGVTFPPEEEVAEWRKKGRDYREVLDFFLSKTNWAKALRRVDRRVGLVGDSVEIKVRFVRQALNAPGCGSGTEGRGSIGFDVESLAEYWRRKREHEARQHMGVTVVPPPEPIGMIAHEIAHCYQGSAGRQPAWFLEGMATYVADDWHFVAFHRNEKEPVKEVDVFSKYKFAYGRGWAFLEYVHAKHGREKLDRLMQETIRKGRRVDECLPEILDLEWAKIKEEEREWSAKWIATYKGKR